MYKIVDIDKVSGAGVSRNYFKNFNVNKRGVVINNSATRGTSQLAGKLSGNSNFTDGKTASIIVNEVTGKGSSLLQGKTEIFGARAEYILSNAFGIVCDGCGFVNTGGVTLTTGQVVSDAYGRIDHFNVTKGNVTIDTSGVDASDASYLRIVSRDADIYGLVSGKEVGILTGANQYSYWKGKLENRLTGEGDFVRYGINMKGPSLNKEITGSIQADRVVLEASELKVDKATGKLVGLDINIFGVVDGKDGVFVKSDGGINIGAQTQVKASNGQVSLLSTAGDVNFSEGSIVNGQGIYIQAGQSIANKGGSLISGSNLTLEALNGGITNTDSGLLTAQKNIVLVANDDIFNKNSSIVADAGIEMKSLRGGISDTHGLIVANDTDAQISISTALGFNGVQSVLRGSNISLLSGEDITLDRAHVTGDKLNFRSGSSMEVMGQTSLLEAFEDLSIYSAGNLSLQGSVSAVSNLEVRASGSISNQAAKIQADTIQANSGEDFLNLTGGIINGRVVALSSGRGFTNRGRIEGRDDLHIMVGEAFYSNADLNNQNGYLLGRKISLKNSNGGILNEGGVIGGSYSEELSVYSKEDFNNDTGSLIQAKVANINVDSSFSLGRGAISVDNLSIVTKGNLETSSGSNIRQWSDGVGEMAFVAGQGISFGGNLTLNQGDVNVEAGSYIHSGLGSSFIVKKGDLSIQANRGDVELADVSVSVGDTLRVFSAKSIALNSSDITADTIDISANSNISAQGLSVASTNDTRFNAGGNLSLQNINIRGGDVSLVSGKSIFANSGQIVSNGNFGVVLTSGSNSLLDNAFIQASNIALEAGGNLSAKGSVFKGSQAGNLKISVDGNADFGVASNGKSSDLFAGNIYIHVSRDLNARGADIKASSGELFIDANGFVNLSQSSLYARNQINVVASRDLTLNEAVLSSGGDVEIISKTGNIIATNANVALEAGDAVFSASKGRVNLDGLRLEGGSSSKVDIYAGLGLSLNSSFLEVGSLNVSAGTGVQANNLNLKMLGPEGSFDVSTRFGDIEISGSDVRSDVGSFDAGGSVVANYSKVVMTSDKMIEFDAGASLSLISSALDASGFLLKGVGGIVASDSTIRSRSFLGLKLNSANSGLELSKSSLVSGGDVELFAGLDISGLGLKVSVAENKALNVVSSEGGIDLTASNFVAGSIGIKAAKSLVLNDSHLSALSVVGKDSGLLKNRNNNLSLKSGGDLYLTSAYLESKSSIDINTNANLNANNLNSSSNQSLDLKAFSSVDLDGANIISDYQTFTSGLDFQARNVKLSTGLRGGVDIVSGASANLDGSTIYGGAFVQNAGQNVSAINTSITSSKNQNIIFNSLRGEVDLSQSVLSGGGDVSLTAMQDVNAIDSILNVGSESGIFVQSKLQDVNLMRAIMTTGVLQVVAMNDVNADGAVLTSLSTRSEAKNIRPDFALSDAGSAVSVNAGRNLNINNLALTSSSDVAFQAGNNLMAVGGLFNQLDAGSLSLNAFQNIDTSNSTIVNHVSGDLSIVARRGNIVGAGMNISNSGGLLLNSGQSTRLNNANISTVSFTQSSGSDFSAVGLKLTSKDSNNLQFTSIYGTINLDGLSLTHLGGISIVANKDVRAQGASILSLDQKDIRISSKRGGIDLNGEDTVLSAGIVSLDSNKSISLGQANIEATATGLFAKRLLGLSSDYSGQLNTLSISVGENLSLSQAQLTSAESLQASVGGILDGYAVRMKASAAGSINVSTNFALLENARLVAGSQSIQASSLLSLNGSILETDTSGQLKLYSRMGSIIDNAVITGGGVDILSRGIVSLLNTDVTGVSGKNISIASSGSLLDISGSRIRGGEITLSAFNEILTSSARKKGLTEIESDSSSRLVFNSSFGNNTYDGNFSGGVVSFSSKFGGIAFNNAGIVSTAVGETARNLLGIALNDKNANDVALETIQVNALGDVSFNNTLFTSSALGRIVSKTGQITGNVAIEVSSDFGDNKFQLISEQDNVSLTNSQLRGVYLQGATGVAVSGASTFEDSYARSLYRNSFVEVGAGVILSGRNTLDAGKKVSISGASVTGELSVLQGDTFDSNDLGNSSNIRVSKFSAVSREGAVYNRDGFLDYSTTIDVSYTASGNIYTNSIVGINSFKLDGANIYGLKDYESSKTLVDLVRNGRDKNYTLSALSQSISVKGALDLDTLFAGCTGGGLGCTSNSAVRWNVKEVSTKEQLISQAGDQAIGNLHLGSKDSDITTSGGKYYAFGENASLSSGKDIDISGASSLYGGANFSLNALGNINVEGSSASVILSTWGYSGLSTDSYQLKASDCSLDNLGCQLAKAQVDLLRAKAYVADVLAITKLREELASGKGDEKTLRAKIDDANKDLGKLMLAGYTGSSLDIEYIQTQVNVLLEKMGYKKAIVGAKGAFALSAGKDVNFKNADISVGGDATIDVGGELRFWEDQKTVNSTATKVSQGEESHVVTQWFGYNKDNASGSYRDDLALTLVSNISVGGDLKVKTRANAIFEGSNFNIKGDTIFDIGGDLNVSNITDMYSHKEDWDAVSGQENEWSTFGSMQTKKSLNAGQDLGVVTKAIMNFEGSFTITNSNNITFRGVDLYASKDFIIGKENLVKDENGNYINQYGVGASNFNMLAAAGWNNNWHDSSMSTTFKMGGISQIVIAAALGTITAVTGGAGGGLFAVAMGVMAGISTAVSTLVAYGQGAGDVLVKAAHEATSSEHLINSLSSLDVRRDTDINVSNAVNWIGVDARFNNIKVVANDWNVSAVADQLSRTEYSQKYYLTEENILDAVGGILLDVGINLVFSSLGAISGAGTTVMVARMASSGATALTSYGTAFAKNYNLQRKQLEILDITYQKSNINVTGDVALELNDTLHFEGVSFDVFGKTDAKVGGSVLIENVSNYRTSVETNTHVLAEDWGGGGTNPLGAIFSMFSSMAGSKTEALSKQSYSVISVASDLKLGNNNFQVGGDFNFDRFKSYR